MKPSTIDGHLFGTGYKDDTNFSNPYFSGLWEKTKRPSEPKTERVLILEITYESAKTWLFNGIYWINGALFMYEEACDEGIDEWELVEGKTYYNGPGWFKLKEGLTVKDILHGMMRLAELQPEDMDKMAALDAVHEIYHDVLRACGIKEASDLTEEDRENLGLNDPAYVAGFNNMTEEEAEAVTEEFKVLLASCKDQMAAGTLKGTGASTMDDKLRGLLGYYVTGLTDAEAWSIATETLGSQGMVELPAGQKLLKQFFASDGEWYDLCSALYKLSQDK